MSLQEIKDSYAVSKGYYDFMDMIECYGKYDADGIYNEVMKIYAMECLKLANKNLSLEECGFDGRDYGITNENNIIK